MRKDNKRFMRVLDDFVRYLNVVEPYHPENGALDCRIFIAVDGFGYLRFCVQDRVASGTVDDHCRFDRIAMRIRNLARDLNSTRLYVDADIDLTCDLYDVDGGLRCQEVGRHDR